MQKAPALNCFMTIQPLNTTGFLGLCYGWHMLSAWTSRPHLSTGVHINSAMLALSHIHIAISLTQCCQQIYYCLSRMPFPTLIVLAQARFCIPPAQCCCSPTRIGGQINDAHMPSPKCVHMQICVQDDKKRPTSDVYSCLSPNHRLLGRLCRCQAMGMSAFATNPDSKLRASARCAETDMCDYGIAHLCLEDSFQVLLAADASLQRPISLALQHAHGVGGCQQLLRRPVRQLCRAPSPPAAAASRIYAR